MSKIGRKLREIQTRPFRTFVKELKSENKRFLRPRTLRMVWLVERLSRSGEPISFSRKLRVTGESFAVRRMADDFQRRLAAVRQSGKKLGPWYGAETPKSAGESAKTSEDR